MESLPGKASGTLGLIGASREERICFIPVIFKIKATHQKRL